ncbi:MAG: AhpC/TSA family protein [Gaiella sp.]
MEAVPEIEAAGARLVVVTPQSAGRAAAWRDELALGDALVIADPERTLYHALGARRPKPLWVLRPRVARAGLRALLAGESVSVTRGDDTLQLGADVVLDRDGQIAFLHLAADAADRTPPQDLIAVVRKLDDSSTPSVAHRAAATG